MAKDCLFCLQLHVLQKGVNDASAFAEVRAENRWSVNRHPLFDDARVEIRLSSTVSVWAEATIASAEQ